MMWYWGYPGWGHMGPFGWVIMVLWWALVIVAIVALIRWFARQTHSSNGNQSFEHKTPLTMLKERYARGEIDKPTFEQMKKDLE